MGWPSGPMVGKFILVMIFGSRRLIVIESATIASTPFEPVWSKHVTFVLFFRGLCPCLSTFLDGIRSQGKNSIPTMRRVGSGILAPSQKKSDRFELFRFLAVFLDCFLSKITGKHAVEVHILKLIPFADMTFSSSFETHSQFL